MTVCLIGVHHCWGGRSLSPAQRDRFAAALGLFEARPAASGHDGATLLASTGKRRGWQPVTGPDGQRVLFAGHIDNRAELARDLGLASASDEALYATGLAAWGDAIDLRAIGQFATIAVARHGEAIRLARSPIAAPPLVYWRGPDILIATSLPNAIFATGEAERRLDYDKVGDSLFLNSKTATQSYFKGVTRLACGHRAVVTRDGATVRSYYDLSALPEIRLKDDRDYQLAATALLEEGVKAALDGFSRPAISLSGGLNSQAVAAFAARQRPGQPIEAFTCVPMAGWQGTLPGRYFGDERPHVEALAALYPEIRPHWIDAAERDFDHQRAAVFLAASDTGPGVLGHFTHEVYARAKASGCDVMLEGVCGNSTFSFAGEGALPAMARRGQWLRLWREARNLGRSQARSTLRVVANQAVLPLVPAWLHNRLARLTGRADLLGEDPYATWCALNRDYAASSGIEERARAMVCHNRSRLPSSSRGTRLETLGHGADDYGESLQAFGILYGMATRDPTSYRPLVEFCLGIPDDQYLREGQSRWLARRMLKGLVPDMVAAETRRGLRVPDWFERLARQRHALIAECDGLLEDSTIASIIDIASLRQALVDWPEEALPIYQHERHMFAVIDGINMAHFIRFVEGRNQ